MNIKRKIIFNTNIDKIYKENIRFKMVNYTLSSAFKYPTLDDELRNCDFIRVVMRISVVMYHSMALWITGGWFNQAPAQESFGLNLIARLLHTFNMYTFVFVSGYIFSFLRCEKGKYMYFWPFIINKIKRLLLPFFVVSIIWAAPIHMYFFKSDLLTLVKRYLLAINPAQLWFLWMIFNVFILFWPLTNLFKNHIFIGGILTILLWGIGTIGSVTMNNYFQLFISLQYLPFFWMGFQVRRLKSRIFYNIPLLVYIILECVLFYICVNYSEQKILLYKIIMIVANVFLSINGTLMLFVLLNKIAQFIKFEKNTFYLFLKKNNLIIYLFHQQIIYFVITALNGRVPSIVLVIANFFSAIVISSLIAWLIDRSEKAQFLLGMK